VRGNRTLSGQLALVAVGATAVWVVLLTVLLNVFLSSQMRGQADDILRTRASAAAATVELDAGGRISVQEPPDDAVLDTGIWIFEGTHLLEKPKGSAELTPEALALTNSGLTYAQTDQEPPQRLFARPIFKDDVQVGTIVAVTSLDPYQRTARSALIASIYFGLLFLAGVYLVTRTVVARALRPVGVMAEQASQWSAHNVEQRFGHAKRPAELRELAANLDSVLDHISAVLSHEKQLAAELSHDLKTPLSVIMAENDLLANRATGQVEQTEGHRVIAETTERMNALLDTLLADASQQITEAPGRCDLESAVRTTTQHLGGAKPEVTVSIVIPPGLEVGASTDVVQRILTQVVGNAYRYAENTVSIRAQRVSAQVEVTVNDDGPGVPKTFREDVFTPGRRANPSDGHPGAGLGLALARRLARTAGGDIALMDTKVGATFCIALPCA
jgi:signal transduction histidine kinase